MPHVSKRKVKEKVLGRIHDRLFERFARLTDAKSSRSFLEEFLTQTERIMFAKRLALIVMLANGYSFSIIERTLKISPATVSRFWKKLNDGALRRMETAIRKEKNRKQFWADLEALIRFGMPPMGRGRWKWFYEMQKSR